ncbi:hypothetical protein C8J57DRAFT_1270713 [Mycena rebaudengoi]|nr:hypothetical protein C8J57DRAFT_1270713 [Mycena rebaudengoi]
MSEHHLPDEILSEILSPALKVRDEDFSNTSDSSPFATYTESSSSMLLVCKDWLRVATPLLYHVVVLRSKAQAKALGESLRKNKDLGRFIKKLRVEGGYGTPMYTILAGSPNLTDLFLSFDILASDSTAGLCKGLPLINPTRLIAHDLHPKKNKMVETLICQLTNLMPKWNHLKIAEFPYGYIDDDSTRHKQFIHAFKNSGLHTVVIHGTPLIHFMMTALKTTTVEVLQIKAPVYPKNYYLLQFLNSPNSALRPRLKYTEEQSAFSEESEPTDPLLFSSFDPAFIPMNAASEETKELIWKRILYFAMSIPELDVDLFRRDIPPRLPFLLVSKTFMRFTLPHLVVHVRLRIPRQYPSFLKALEDKPALGPQIRSIQINEGRFAVPGTESTISDILSHTTALVHLYGDEVRLKHTSVRWEEGMYWSTFALVAKTSGPTLREFSYRIRDTPGCEQSPAIFSHLQQVELLEWKSNTVFDSKDEPSICDALPKLKELRVDITNPSFLTTLARMELPSLRKLFIVDDHSGEDIFLETHGAKLVELDVGYSRRCARCLKVDIFDVCPNLALLSIYWDDCIPWQLDELFAKENVALTKLIFNTPRVHSKEELTYWDRAFFCSFDARKFPALTEIAMNCFSWPTTEREISKSCWVGWAESLLEHDVHLTDDSGKSWRPRLKKRK